MIETAEDAIQSLEERDRLLELNVQEHSNNDDLAETPSLIRSSDIRFTNNEGLTSRQSE